MTRVLSICHPGGGTSGVFHLGAADAGCAIEEWTPALAHEPPRPLDEYAGLVVLGGDQNVCEQDRFPYLAREIELIERWLASGRPLLGVCLGAQLLAQAAGGSVVPASSRELGWLEVELLPAAARDPLFGLAPRRMTAMQWHSYSVELPEGARALAASPVCVQAFRLHVAWGVQFHPEVDAAILAAWTAELRASEPPRTADAHAIESGIPAHLGAWNSFGRELFRRFSSVLG